MVKLKDGLKDTKKEILELTLLRDQLLDRINKRNKEILSMRETMELLDIDQMTFDNYCEQGILITYRLGKGIYCKYSQIENVLDQGIQAA